MTDTIIKGTGNSRSIKSVPNLATLAPTYEKLLEYLTGEGLPVDIGPLNAAGVDVQGSELTKSTLLSGATEQTIWGNTGNRTVDAALSRLRSLVSTAQETAEAAQSNVSSRTQCQSGTYIGNGQASHTLTFSFAPRFVAITCENSSFIAIWVQGNSFMSCGTFVSRLTVSGNSLIFTDAELNHSSYRFYYAAFR